MTKHKELNQKLAEWVGFTKPTQAALVHETLWVYPDKAAFLNHVIGKPYLNRLPNFPESLDACFKWLTPKLERENRYDYIHFGHDLSCPEINTVQITYLDKLLATGENESPALALCKAIEKIISEEVTNGHNKRKH